MRTQACPSTQLSLTSTKALMALRCSGVILLTRVPRLALTTLPCQPTRYARTESGFASGVPEKATSVPRRLPLGIGPDGLDRKRSSRARLDIRNSVDSVTEVASVCAGQARL